MANFDFIRGAEFRQSLEDDQRELGAAIASKSWKIAQVLAGSIIEAILMDHLMTTDYQARTGKNPLEMDLAKIIVVCENEKVISTEVAQLSNVVKSYRNLIHPGRAIRLGEKADENKASVAKALVEMIVETLRHKLIGTSENSAEQVVTKLKSDPSALAIVDHLFQSAGAAEVERLLVEVLPKAYFEAMEDLESSYLPHLQACYRAAFDYASVGSKRRACAKLIHALKTECQARVFAYETAFFKGGDLPHFEEAAAALLKKHLLSRLETVPIVELVRALSGIEPYLDNNELCAYFDAMLWNLAMGNAELRSAIYRELLPLLLASSAVSVRSCLVERIGAAAQMWDVKSDGPQQMLRAIRAHNPDDIPF